VLGCLQCGQDNPEGARFCLACGAALAAPPPDRRKLATVLFCDVTGSTALGERTDPETVRELMFRYFHEMRSAIERHGGTVEKFAGDAVMAAFGIPEAHEDDALRACRAALEMQERMAELAPELERRFGTRLQPRIGINTGEVVAGAGRDTFATGDAVNVAARLEQAAAPGDVLLGGQTFALVQDAVEAEQVPPVHAKGKAEPVPTFRLRYVATTAPVRAASTALVGRAHELRILTDALAEAVRDGRTQLLTVVGEPGVGKSRLVAEFEREVPHRLLRGRCLSYGEGITYWPLAEIVREAARIRDEDSVEKARLKIVDLVDPEIASRIAALVGLGGTVAPDEVGWAVRRFLAGLASEGPLVLVVEDIHWAEPTLFDLLIDLERLDASVLILATARPELLDERVDWPGVVRLEPLAQEDAVTLLAELLGREPSEELVARAGGNPLFAHELAALLRERGDAAGIPATLTALLGARLDRLPPAERDAVERASVEGEIFHRGALAALLDADLRATAERISALVDHEFAFPTESRLVDEAAYRFRHVLVRDTAYSGLVKRLRAELHERLADWLESKAADRLGEVEEIVGYHFEQAHRYRVELGLAGDEVGKRAAEHLFSAGSRAAERGDVPAAVNLLRRAVDLTTSDEPTRPERLLRLARYFFLGGDLDRVGPTYDEAERLAAEAGDERMLAFARLERWREPGVDEAELRTVAEAALPMFEAAADDLGLSKAWAAIADYHWSRSEIALGHEGFERALAYARRAGDREQVDISLARLGGGLRFGPLPVDDGIARIERELRNPSIGAHSRAVWTAFLGALEARRGNVERGRDLCASGRRLAEEIGDVLAGFWTCEPSMEVELLAGALPAADEFARENLERTERMGHVWPDQWRPNVARVLLDQGRFGEADAVLAVIEPPNNPWANAVVNLLRARLLTREGRHGEAERLARAAVKYWESTDADPLRADAYRALGEVLRLGGKPGDARAAFERALELEARLGATLLVKRTRTLIAEVG